MASEAAEPGSVPLSPAPAERLSDRVRRRWRSRGRHRNIQFWLLFRGLPILAVLLGVYLGNGVVIGWANAYDVMLGITSPADTSAPALAWTLSIAGWLVAPAVAGALAGYVVSSQITSRRRRSVEDVFGEELDG